MTLEEFSRIFSAQQMSKIVRTGLGMPERQDKPIDVLGGSINQGFSRTDQNFNRMDIKIG